MIRKYVFGEPIETDAVEIRIPAETKAFTEDHIRLLSPGRQGGSVFVCPMSDGDRIYGLGENVRGINKRGWIYESNCSDDPNHTEEKHSLYGAHNFLIFEPAGGRERFGLFIDCGQKVIFDCGYTDRKQLRITVAEGGFVLYILENESLLDMVHEFRSMIGRSYIPPKWAFGYGQSRWGYRSAEDVRQIVREHRDQGVPLDSVYMDIDYMERFKDFTVDAGRFPDFPEFVEEMSRQHIHLVPIIDAGVKIEKGYPVYEEGLANGYFCKNEDGTPFVGGAWPGRVHFPDVLNPDARKWFGDWYRVLLDAGIEGFWNDMNEPALFYSEAYLQEAFRKLTSFRTDDLDIWKFFELKGTVLSMANRPEDFRSFYHNMNGKMIRHDRVHNLYGSNMTRAAGEAFERLSPEKRILIFSRSSCIGMHRCGGIWMGDNQSWWSHLLMNMQMLPSLNMCGFLYIGADLGGFGSDTTADLLIRWLELGIFTPLMRNHSSMGTREQEFYRFGEPETFQKIIGLRYALLPYLYSEFMKAALSGGMMFIPLAFVWPEDGMAVQTEDQLMVGESLMIAPVYRQNAAGRYVYLPEEMKLYRMRSAQDMDVEILEAGHHFVRAELGEVLIFVRADHLVPLAEGGQYVEQVNTSSLRLMHFVKEEAVYQLYDDDGYSRNVELAGHLTEIRVTAGGGITAEGAMPLKCELI